MTTTASKHGLRAAATAKSTKAAQRTPLPPKSAKAHAENLQLVQEAVEETKPAKRAPRKSGPSKAETAQRAQLAAKALQPTRRKAAPVEEAPAPPAPEAKVSKADHYAAEFTRMGWTPEITWTDGLAELVAKRGSEAIYIAWLNDTHVPGTSTYTYADRTIKIRNASEACRIGSRPASVAKEIQNKVSSNRSFVKRATGPTVRSVPFDVGTATDAEIIEALAGHQINWHNSYRVESESATVGDPAHIRVDRHRGGHRIVSFIDPESGFRAFRLDHLENVGRKVDLKRIKQEILNSLHKEAKKSAKAA